MHELVRFITGRDWSRMLLLIALLGIVGSLWLVAANETGTSTQRGGLGRGIGMHGRPTNANVKRTQPFISDYTLPLAQDGMAPVITRIDTKQPVVFLTIDDGAHKDRAMLAIMEKYHLKASLFLARTFIDRDTEFFSRFVKQGSLVENHTVHHDLKMTKDMNYAQQKAEICGMADYEQQVFGRRPELYRPPGGTYTDMMRHAAHDCGMKAIVTWIVTVNNGSLQYQVGNMLRPGDIVLMHFRPTFATDLEAFVKAARRAQLTPELLETAMNI